MGHAPTGAYTGPAGAAWQGKATLAWTLRTQACPLLTPGGAQFPQEGPHLQTVPSTLSCHHDGEGSRSFQEGERSWDAQPAGPPQELTSSSLPCMLGTPPVGQLPRLREWLRQKRDISIIWLRLSETTLTKCFWASQVMDPQPTIPSSSHMSRWHQTQSLKIHPNTQIGQCFPNKPSSCYHCCSGDQM